jgi:hypothetical protein
MIQKLDLDAAFLQFLKHQHLVYIVAGQPIRFSDQNHIELSQGRPIPQAIQARSIQLGPTVAIIHKHVLRLY